TPLARIPDAAVQGVRVARRVRVVAAVTGAIAAAVGHVIAGNIIGALAYDPVFVNAYGLVDTIVGGPVEVDPTERIVRAAVVRRVRLLQGHALGDALALGARHLRDPVDNRLLAVVLLGGRSRECRCGGAERDPQACQDDQSSSHFIALLIVVIER